jgi:Fe-S-cluster containining protein
MESDAVSPCNTCGACCAHSAEWPRFTCEDDAALDRLPRNLVNARGSGMRCVGERCTALVGTVGVATSCAVYAIRPDVCRDCQPGDEACNIARRARGLSVLVA